MKNAISTIVILLMGCLSLVGCSKVGNLEKYYSIEASNDGWSLEDCVIGVQDGKLAFESGNLSINSNFELFEIEIHQENQAGDKDHIFGQSYSIIDGVRLNKSFDDIQIKDKNIDINSELKGEIKVINGKQGDAEEIYKLAVNELKANEV